MSRAPESIAGLPYGEQVAAIDEALSDPAQVAPLLRAVGRFRDVEPLAYLLGSLLTRGLLDPPEPSLLAALQMALSSTSDAGVARLLARVEAQQKHVPPALVEVVLDTLRVLPLHRIAAICFLDRWLKNHAPEAREALCEESFQQCKTALATGNVEALVDSRLVLVPGTRWRELAQAAAQHGLSDAYQERLARFAARVLDTLEAAPKSLSQANAEEILSRRVYTDPGHFLFELLQNAEDAGAARWRVEVAADRLTLHHDGLPFDAKDVVGVLSIGQTTKRRGQIGFFGVGFKSVYEVTDRPQLYSGPFAFEIADVSMPRRLQGRPASSLPEETSLVLPLRDPRAASKTPSELFRRLRELPAETLLTLRHLRELSFSFGTETRKVLRESSQADTVLLSDEPGQGARRYWVSETRVRFAGAREANRPQEAPLLVALRLGEGGLPEPLPQEAPSLFCYLPTKERSGLRLLIHAHFDLPVDRERVDLSSAWNAWLLEEAGALLGERFSAETRPEMRRALLALVPLPRELHHPALVRLAEVLREKLARARFLVGAAGEDLFPEKARILFDDRLAPFFAGLALDTDESRALAPLEDRSRAVALWLGARSFSPAEMLACLAHVLPGTDKGSPLRSRAFLSLLGTLSLGAHSAELAALPLWPDTQHEPGPAAQRFRAAPALRAVYQGVRPLLDESLDLAPSPDEARLLAWIDCPRLALPELARDLREPALAEKFPKDGRLFSLLSQLGERDLAGLGTAHLFPDTTGIARPLRGDEKAWLWPAEPLRTWLRGIRGAPALVEESTQREHEALFLRLGGEPFGLSSVLRAVQRGALTLSKEESLSLHGVLASMHEQLSPALCAVLAETPIFLDATGALRPLRGEARTLLGDLDLRPLAPSAPWISADLLSFSYLRGLGVAWLGAREVLGALLGNEVGFSVEGERARDALGYLAAHRDTLSRADAERLASAPIWHNARGERRRLAELRRPATTEALRALYAAWSVGEVIESGDETSSLSRAESLGLGEFLPRAHSAQLIDDLLTHGAPPESLRRYLVEALNEAPQWLSGRELARVMEAAVFSPEGGTRPARLESWEGAPRGGVRRAFGALREAFRGAVPLLSSRDETELAPLLQALPARPAALEELLAWCEAEALAPGALPAARAALRPEREALARLEAKAPGRLSRVPLWPTRAGRVKPASQVVRAGELADLFGPRWREESLPEALEGSLLATDAEPDAEDLRGLVSFLAPVEVVAARLLAEAREGEALSAQAAWIGDLSSLVKLAALLAKHQAPEALCALPLSVDAAGRLVKGRRFRSTADEATLAEGTPLAEELASPAWSEALRAALPAPASEALCPPLAARRLLAALAEHARQTLSAEEHPRWRAPEARLALYRWLSLRSAEIEGDEQALGIFGRACLLPSAGGALRSPRELLFDAGLPDVGLDWDAAEEVPRPLCAWLRRVYRVEERRLAQMVGRLLEAHKEAAAANDGARSELLLRGLARVLHAAPEGLAALVERFSLSRHLKIEDQRGEFQRVRRLLAPDAERWTLLESFCETLPPRVSARYHEPEVLALLRAVGAPRTIEAESLAHLLRGEGRKDGLPALLALARYVSLVVLEDPAQQHALGLDRAAWLPDGDGIPKSPGALYWPTPETLALLGEDPARYPHPEVALTVPASITQRLRFRRLEEAPLDDVLVRLRDGEPVPPELLRWLDEGLRNRRIEAAALRIRLAGLRVFLDEEGKLRPFSQLLRVPARELFGQRRGHYPEARRVSHLADALGISHSLGAKEFAAFYDELAQDLSRHGTHALQSQEPELVACLLRLLSRLAERATRPEVKRFVPSVLVAEAARGEVFLVERHHPRVRLPIPVEEAEEARRAGLWLVVLPSENAEEAAALLRPDVAMISEEKPAPARPRPVPQPPGETRAEPTQEPPPDTARGGLLARLKRWARGDEEHREERPAPTAPPSEARQSAPRPSPSRARPAAPSEPETENSLPLRPDGRPADLARAHRDWFRPRGSIEPQLRTANAWLDDRARAPEFGFSFAPRSLPVPYRYAPQLIANRLDPRTQRWMPGRAAPSWSLAEGPVVATVQLRGRVPAGESQVPVPLYASLGSVEALGQARHYTTQAGQVVLSSAFDGEAALTLQLHAAPEFSEAQAPEAPREFVEPTVPDDELPAEVLSWIEAARQHSARTRALAVREFIRERYRYDPTYLEDEQAARWLRGVTQGKANQHIAALHAWRDAQHLGRGVCYELNALACELLRRVGLPAAIAVGWTFERGSLSEPDHLWAMALLPSASGPRWFPVDAATTREGRPLRVSQRPQGSWRGPASSGRAPASFSWDTPGQRVSQDIPPTAELLRVARYLAGRNGLIEPDSLLRQRCFEMLQDPEQARRLLDLLRSAE